MVDDGQPSLALPVAIRNLGPWTGSKEGEVGHHGLEFQVARARAHARTVPMCTMARCAAAHPLERSTLLRGPIARLTQCRPRLLRKSSLRSLPVKTSRHDTVGRTPHHQPRCHGHVFRRRQKCSESRHSSSDVLDPDCVKTYTDQKSLESYSNTHPNHPRLDT